MYVRPLPPTHIFLLCLILLTLTMPGNLAAGESQDQGAAPTTISLQQHGENLPQQETHSENAAQEHAELNVPSAFWCLPFLLLLMAIAILPLIPATAQWWHHNSSKLLVALLMAAITVAYYYFRGYGFGHGDHVTAARLPCVLAMLNHAVLKDYVPFIVLLFSLYCISGGINLRGDITASPLNNTIFIAIGAVLANLIGTTGAAMLLIRPLLQINSQRKYRRHTVIFFIFLACNIGGCLLPIGDPPLFLGYLRGVPFLWTTCLVKEWLVMTSLVLIVYYFWDRIVWRHEPPEGKHLDYTQIEPLRLIGSLNFVWLAGVVLAVALLDPSRPLFGRITIEPFLRESVMLLMVVLAWRTTNVENRKANGFNFVAIGEVGCLFIGIFIAMQAPVEILNLKGAALGLKEPWHFFWATGLLSSLLDNAPTYVVFFETAKSVPIVSEAVEVIGGSLDMKLLVAISIGAVFMGANTYIGNGPNFMVKSIAESHGVKMPSFFGYMVYSALILTPIYLIITFVFL